ncbi:hypothetical protein OGAPHI_004126 [Ogataea philodendri]|uniref:Mannosyltransferase n=1 Tax=Ogataea philodendri TaxID=1378263 RepID=A0A9P8P6Y4_9ASCO|nr:uncharacterized protein OGAPHI_004126 [Ogataea philodendri]KAH3665937.1 hypothetical protein OGAPHI_004126 [Ogataea philodendri]
MATTHPKLAGLPIPSSDAKVFILLLSIRLVNSLSIKTFFQADEYWQALEPAHYFVFGYGYLTWEWQQGIRSFLHPLLYVPIYKTCRQFDLDYSYVLYLPKVLNALICATGETFQYKLAIKLTRDHQIASLMFYLSLLSPFNWYCYCRSFSNSLELTLTNIALYLFPSHFNANYPLSIFVAGLCCLIRPTSALTWAFYGVRCLISGDRVIILFITIITALGVILIDISVNYSFYGKLIFPTLEFLQFNVSKSLSSFYGVSRLDFYIFQAIPVLLLTYIPFFIIGLVVKKHKQLKLLLILNLAAFSLIQHKEFRFIYPLMPILLLFAAYGVQYIASILSPRTRNLVFSTLIITNISISYYFTQIHESGVISVTKYLRDEITDQRSSVGFLTPCHSTPFQSHFHIPPEQVDIWFLTCEPPLHLNSSEGLDNYMDESDEFYDNTLGFLETNFPALTPTSREGQVSGKYPHHWPEYLVFFEHLEPLMKQYLENSKYSESHRLFNSRFHWDHRRTGDLIIYKYD